MSDVFAKLESDVRVYSRQFPVVFSKASGCYMYAASGERYLDFLSGAGSLNYGHNNDYIIQAVIDYLRNGNVVHSLDLMTEAKELFLLKLRDCILRPRGLPYKCQFTGPTGTNAVEAALKLARKVTRRTNVVAFTNSYHGLSLGALAVTANREKRSAAGIPLSSSIFMPYDGFLGPGVDTSAYINRMLSDLGSGIDRPAAILLETIQGEGGLNVASESWLKAISDLAKHLGALLIVDDIQAGCGRSGAFFSFEQAGILPDIVVLSKSLSGFGSPFSLVLMREDLDIWKPGEHNGTFRGNNLAFVGAASALSRYWTDESFISGVRDKAASFRQALTDLCNSSQDAVTGVKGRGMMIGCQFTEPRLASKVSQMMFERGVIIETCGPGDNVLKFLPPLTITDLELNECLSVFEDVLREIAGGLGARRVEEEGGGRKIADSNVHAI